MQSKYKTKNLGKHQTNQEEQMSKYEKAKCFFVIFYYYYYFIFGMVRKDMMGMK